MHFYKTIAVRHNEEQAAHGKVSINNNIYNSSTELTVHNANQMEYKLL